MEIVVRAFALALTGSVLALVLKKREPELALLLGLLCAAAVLSTGLRLAQGLAQTLRETAEHAGLRAAVLHPVLKCVGIGVLTRLGADLCRDAGQTAPASALELCGAAAALAAALPLFQALLELVLGLV